MLAETEPHADVTGGLAGADYFDIELTQVVMERVEHHVRKMGQATRKELLVYIKQLGVLPGDKLLDDDIS